MENEYVQDYDEDFEDVEESFEANQDTLDQDLDLAPEFSSPTNLEKQEEDQEHNETFVLSNPSQEVLPESIDNTQPVDQPEAVEQNFEELSQHSNEENSFELSKEDQDSAENSGSNEKAFGELEADDTVADDRPYIEEKEADIEQDREQFQEQQLEAYAESENEEDSKAQLEENLYSNDELKENHNSPCEGELNGDGEAKSNSAYSSDLDIEYADPRMRSPGAVSVDRDSQTNFEYASEQIQVEGDHTIEKLRQENRQLHAQLEDLNKLVDEQLSLRGERVRHRSSKNSQTKEMQGLMKKLQIYKKANEDLKRQLKSSGSSERVIHLSDLLKDKKRQIKALKEENKSLQNVTRKQGKALVEAEHEDIERKIRCYEDDARVLKEQFRKAKHRLNEDRETINKQNRMIAKLSEKLQIFKANKVTVEDVKTMKKLKEELRHKQDLISSLENNISILRKASQVEQAKTKHEITKSTKEMKELRHTIQQLQKELEIKDHLLKEKEIHNKKRARSKHSNHKRPTPEATSGETPSVPKEMHKQTEKQKLPTPPATGEPQQEKQQNLDKSESKLKQLQQKSPKINSIGEDVENLRDKDTSKSEIEKIDIGSEAQDLEQAASKTSQILQDSTSLQISDQKSETPSNDPQEQHAPTNEGKMIRRRPKRPQPFEGEARQKIESARRKPVQHRDSLRMKKKEPITSQDKAQCEHIPPETVHEEPVEEEPVEEEPVEAKPMEKPMKEKSVEEEPVDVEDGNVDESVEPEETVKPETEDQVEVRKAEMAGEDETSNYVPEILEESVQDEPSDHGHNGGIRRVITPHNPVKADGNVSSAPEPSHPPSEEKKANIFKPAF